MKKDLISLLYKMYFNERSCYGIEYFSKFINQLKKYDFAEILAYQTKYPLRYVLEFILSVPSFWTKMSDTDWVRVMSKLTPRPNPFSKELDDAGYVDIHFLCKYVKINAIELFLQQKQFSNEDKKKLLQYSRKVADSLFINELDLEDLDGNYYVSFDELHMVKLNLISTGNIKPFTYTEDELRKYIEEELAVLSS